MENVVDCNGWQHVKEEYYNENELHISLEDTVGVEDIFVYSPIPETTLGYIGLLSKQPRNDNRRLST